MGWLEGIVLGIIQGLTEFLPVSSSGHLAIAGTFFGMSGEENLAFAILVHIATVLSTVIVLRKDIAGLCKELFPFHKDEETQQVVFSFRWNDDTKMIAKLLLSMIPVGIVGLFFRDTVEAFFGSGLLLIGCMLLLTATLLLISAYPRFRQKENISFRDACIIGLAQACAVLPGLSRSGTTIATGLWLGNQKEKVAKFSFLMVMLPVLGETLLDMLKLFKGETSVFTAFSATAMISGFAAAFISGLFACKWMIGLVKNGKLQYFAYYCIAIGGFVIIYTLFTT